MKKIYQFRYLIIIVLFSLSYSVAPKTEAALCIGASPLPQSQIQIQGIATTNGGTLPIGTKINYSARLSTSFCVNLQTSGSFIIDKTDGQYGPMTVTIPTGISYLRLTIDSISQAYLGDKVISGDGFLDFTITPDMVSGIINQNLAFNVNITSPLLPPPPLYPLLGNSNPTPAICISWTYSNWNVCTNNQQTRTITSTQPENCTGGNPILSQSCNYTLGAIPNKVSNVETKDNPPISTNNQNLQNDSTLTKNNEQEVNQEKTITSSQVAEQRKSEVANVVQNIIQIVEKDSGVGEQIKTIAQTQVQSQEKLEISLQKVQSRSGFTKFFIGPDYGEINNANKLLEQNREQIKQLDEVQNQLTDKTDKQKLTEQVRLLEQTNQEVENSLNTSQKGFSLFGWIFRLFVK